MNLRELLNNNNFNEICIPRLQRDYAQGRKTDKIRDIRDKLLTEIFSGKPVHLNMIFGEEVKGRFIPIDGQQRLTTLFLLYLYRHKVYRTDQEDETLKKFTYETRRSSTDFIKHLVKNKWPESIGHNKFSQTIRNENWYRIVWDEDPTVEGMLVMLDEIHNRAIALATPEEFPDLEALTFDFEDLKGLGLNESLYIKMNSRGLELNNFEIIKCSIENCLPKGHLGTEKDCFQSYVYEDNIQYLRAKPFADQWKWCIDRKWADWFWNRTEHEGATYFLKFIMLYTIGFDAALGSGSQKDKSLRFSDIRARFNNNTLSWQHLVKGLDSTQDYLVRLAKLLNRIVSTDGDFRSAWGDEYSFKNIKDDSLKPTAVIFALSCYTGSYFEGCEFDEWLRVCFNLIENIDSVELFITICKEINDLSDISTDILNGLLNRGKLSKRLEQEREKAKLLLRGVAKVREAERHKLFRGNIRQLLVDKHNHYTHIFNNIKWNNLKKYFDEDGKFRKGIEYDFVVAFLKSCDKAEQLNNSSEILNFSGDNVRNRLQTESLVSVFDNILGSTNLNEVKTYQISDSEEWNQYRDAICHKEIVHAVLSRVRTLSFVYKGMMFLLRKGSHRTSNDYIALDYKLPDGSRRYRNRFLADIGYDGNRVADHHNLWWGADIRFKIKEQAFEWTIWNWIYPLTDSGDRLKDVNGNELCLNPYNIAPQDLAQELLRLISPTPIDSTDT